MKRCDNCSAPAGELLVEWTQEHEWRSVCHKCRLVPTLTATGRLKLIRVGGE